MLLKLVVRLLGGHWALKARCSRSRVSALRRFYIRLYDLHQAVNASSIAWDSTFAGMPCFPHGMHGIFISGGARIGRNCVIFQHVTIGSNTLPDSRGLGAPTIGDNCYIGAGAKIVGNVKIGNNVRIGANAVVYHDVSDNCVVVLDGMRTIQKESPLVNRFYSFRGKLVYYDDGHWIEETDPTILEQFKRGTNPSHEDFV